MSGCYGLRLEVQLPPLGGGDWTSHMVDVSPDCGGFSIDFIDDKPAFHMPLPHPILDRLYACDEFADDVRDAVAEDRRLNG